MIITKNTCIGCGTCAAACPGQCIRMKETHGGSLIPCVDEIKCIHCGLCTKTCPQNFPPARQYPIDCYAAWSTTPSDYVHSASGGVAAAFARFQLAQNAAIYGCDYDENGDLRHFLLCDETDIRRMQSSKYSQSAASGCFNEIKSLLEQDRSVVFIGTPCQVAGLLRFLKKDYASLVTVDLICHGAPPNAYLKQHLAGLSLDAPYQKIRFRGEYDQMLTVWKENKIVYQKDRTEDEYFIAFYENMISYDSCFTCQYAGPERVSDITIGDFWGLGKLQKIDYLSNRPSIILVNTEKGQAFFEKANCNLIYEQRDVMEGIRGNGRLIQPPGKNYKAGLFRWLCGFPSVGFRKRVRVVSRISKAVDSVMRFLVCLAELKTMCLRKVTNILKGGSHHDP